MGSILPCAVGTGCTVRADLGSKVAFGARTYSLHIQDELQLALPERSKPSKSVVGLSKFVEVLLDCNLISFWPKLGPLGRLLGSTLEPRGCNLETLGRLFLHYTPDLGSKRFNAQTLDDRWCEISARAIDVETPLLSVSQLVRNGSTGTFSPKGLYID